MGDKGSLHSPSHSVGGPGAPTSKPGDETGDLYDEERVKECLRVAEELKQEGNDLFREGKWDEALSAYRAGLGRLPKRRENRPSSKLETDESLSEEESHKENDEGEDDTAKVDRKPLEELSGLDQTCAQTRAVMNANIGACYVKLDDHKEAVKACTQALSDDPHYIKALQRRAASNEKIDSWSSLTSAQEDYTTLLTLLPSGSPQIRHIDLTLHRLKPRVEAAQKRETSEMMDKLKGLGNSILGNFGLSTDNFKFEPNGQGGYSMNFAR